MNEWNFLNWQGWTAWHFAIAGSGLLLLLIFGVLAYRIRYWIIEGRKLQEVGYLTPRVTIFARFARWMLTRFTVWLKVGRLTVIGRQHIQGKARKLIVPNHQIEHDAGVIPAVLRFLYFRGLMAITQIVGIRRPICAWLGVVPVHHAKDPRAAVRVSVEVLKAEPDSSMVAFPQGALHRTNVLKVEDFFAGIILIGRMAGPKDGPNPFVTVPTGVYYDRDPAHASWFQWAVRKLGFKSFRHWFGETTYGVTVVFGEPIALDALPKDKKEAMAVVFEKIKEASDRARTETLKRFGESDTPSAA